MIEFYGAVTYYGIGDIIRKYSGFPSFLPLPVSIQHGWDIAPNAHDAREDAPENWYWSINIERQYRIQYPNITTRTSGAPFLYLLKSINYSPSPEVERSGSIVFPSHSSGFVEMNCDFDEYADMLAGLPDQYKPITICMYFIDRDRGLDAPFLRKGFQVVTNGSNLYESDFLLNFVGNTKDKRFAFSNQMTSALLFASAMGLISYFWGPEFKVNNADPNWQHLDYNQYFRFWEDRYKRIFRFPDCDLLEQKVVAENELGVDRILTPPQMRRLLWQLACHPKYLQQLETRLSYHFRRSIKRTLRKTAVGLTGSKALETMTPREFAKLFVPPILLQAWRALRYGKQSNVLPQERLHLTGDYPSWAAALADSTGYNADVILEKTTTALLKVKNDEAVYERDSVLFDKIEYAWPLLTGLLWVAARCGGSLNVLDFGGSLGSSYFQNRAFLSALPCVRWNIIEQEKQVEVGRNSFEDDNLRFYPTISACLTDTSPQVIILSSVLQYLEHPYFILEKLLDSPCNYLIIDRTPFWNGPADRLCVQHVPAEIYAASYPSWIFSTPKFHAFLNKHMGILAEFDNPDRLPGPVAFAYRGLIATRRESSSA